MYKTKTQLAKIDKYCKSSLLLLVCTYVGNEVLKVLSHFGVISRRFRRGLCFVLLGGLCTKRRPWLKLMKTANLFAPCSTSVNCKNYV